MKLVIFEDRNYHNFFPIAHLRPTFELRCGHRPLYAKIIRNQPELSLAFFCRDYLTESFSQRVPAGATVNDTGSLQGDLLVVNGCLLPGERSLENPGREEVVFSESGEVLYAWIGRDTARELPHENFHTFLAAAAARLPRSENRDLPLLRWQWDLIRHNPREIETDFRLKGGSGRLGTVHESVSLFGPPDRLYVGPEAEVHPQVVLDTRGGSIYVDQGAVVYPHSRIEGPCYIGPETWITRGNIHEGCSFGPLCRVGGEVEESIIQGWSNKVHDGFLGHAYVGEWVNLGAFTTNSDLKNDYGTVSLYMQDSSGEWDFVESGDTKVGCFIGDHTKTSIGTLLNTGSHVGAMTLLMGDGRVLPKFIPSFAWYLEGAITGGFGYKNLIATAEKVTARRKRTLTDPDRRLLDHVYELTAPERKKAIKKDRRKLLGK